MPHIFKSQNAKPQSPALTERVGIGVECGQKIGKLLECDDEIRDARISGAAGVLAATEKS